MTYFGPALDPPLGGSGRKITTLVRDHEYFIPTKFHQNPSSGSGEEVENVKSLRVDDGHSTTDTGRRRTDRRRTVHYNNSSLEPSSPVSLKLSKLFHAVYKTKLEKVETNWKRLLLRQVMYTYRSEWTIQWFTTSNFNHRLITIKIWFYYQHLQWQMQLSKHKHKRVTELKHSNYFNFNI